MDLLVKVGLWKKNYINMYQEQEWHRNETATVKRRLWLRVQMKACMIISLLDFSFSQYHCIVACCQALVWKNQWSRPSHVELSQHIIPLALTYTHTHTHARFSVSRLVDSFLAQINKRQRCSSFSASYPHLCVCLCVCALCVSVTESRVNTS